LADEAFDFPKVTDLIGRDPQPAMRSKCAMDRGEKLFRYDPATPVSPLRPGIGKHQMELGDRIGWQHLLNCVRSFDPQDAGIRELALRDFPARLPHSLEKTFNSKKIPAGIGRGHLHQKRPISAPKVDLNRSASTINGLQIERCKIIRWNDFAVCSASRKFSGLKHLH